MREAFLGVCEDKTRSDSLARGGGTLLPLCVSLVRERRRFAFVSLVPRLDFIREIIRNL